MKLSKTERLILSNQYAILKHLEPSNHEYYELMKKAVDYGYEREIEEDFNHIYDGLSSEECDFVLNVLDMYTQLMYSNKELDESEQEDIKFPGFDGNNETVLLGYTRFILSDKKEFEIIPTSTEFYDFNSHRQMVSRYERMLSVWRESVDRFRLTKDEIRKIINTR